jgi:hypothetical protein
LNNKRTESLCNRVVSKVRKTQHQNPEFEFGHTQDEIKKKPAKKYISIQPGGGGGGGGGGEKIKKKKFGVKKF